MPLCALHIVVRAGVIDEGPDEIGAAHFLEHMLFKGTAALAPGEVTQRVESLGGDLEAYTSLDETTLQMTIDAGELSSGLEIVAEVLRRATLDDVEIERERRVILEEMRSYDDDADTATEEAAAAALFPQHAYGRPVLGTRADLNALSQRHLRSFYERCYTPSRTTVVVVGAVDSNRVRTLVEQTLGTWKPNNFSPNSDSTAAPAPPTNAVVAGITDVARPFTSRSVQIAFRAPPRGHPDTAAIAVWTAALAEGASGRLIRRLESEDECATSTWSSLEHHRHAGALTFGWVPRAGGTANAIRSALDEIARSVAPGLNAGEVFRAREMLVADFLFPSESYDSRAQELAEYESQGRFSDVGVIDADAVREAQRRELAVLTAESVQRAAERWIRPDQAVIAVLDGANSEPKARAKLVHAAQAPTLAVRRPAGPQRHVFPNGATLWVTTNDRPTIEVECVLAGGSLAEPAENAGIGSAWSRVVGTAAGDLDPDAMGDVLDEYAMVLEATSGRSAMTVRSSFPASWAMEALDLFGLVLQKPNFDPKEWERTREEMLEELRQQVDRPEQIAEDAAWASLWSGHPWGRPLHGTTKSLARLDTKRIQRWHRERFGASNVIVGVTGGVSMDEVKEALGPSLASLPKGSPDLPARAAPALVAPPPLRAGRQQVHVWWASRHSLTQPRDFLALKLATSALHAQGGRLFSSLRERRALAYSVWSEAWSGPDGGLFTVALATDPHRAGEARQALHAELQRYEDLPLDLDEIQRYKRLMTTQTALALQTASARNADLVHGERFGVPWGFERRQQMIEDLQPAEIHRALTHALHGPATTIVVEPIA